MEIKITSDGNERQKSGFEDESPDFLKNICMNPGHNPPGHLFIPPGKIYRHVCPGCEKTTRIRPAIVTC